MKGCRYNLFYEAYPLGHFRVFIFFNIHIFDHGNINERIISKLFYFVEMNLLLFFPFAMIFAFDCSQFPGRFFQLELASGFFREKSRNSWRSGSGYEQKLENPEISGIGIDFFGVSENPEVVAPES